MITVAKGQTVTFVGTLTTYNPETDSYDPLTSPDSVTLTLEDPNGATVNGATPAQVGATNKFAASHALTVAGVWYAQITANEGTAVGLNRRLAVEISVEGSVG